MVRRYLMILLASIAAIPALQTAGAETPPPADAPPADADVAEIKPRDFVYVAATRRDQIGRVLAPVFINDVGPFAFLIDTGASSSVVGPRVASRLKLKPATGRTKLLLGITGTERVPSVFVDKLSAGQIELANRELPMIEPRVFADADGIFGVDAFSSGCLLINFSVKRVSILKSRCPRVSEQWEVMRTELRFGGLAIVPARIGKVKVMAIIDTGAERTLGNPALFTALGLDKRAIDAGTSTVVSSATPQLIPGNIVKTPSLRMGTVEIANMHVVFGDFQVFEMWGVNQEAAIVLGMDVLGTTGAMMLDFTRKELSILPNITGDYLPMRKRGPASRIPRD